MYGYELTNHHAAMNANASPGYTKDGRFLGLNYAEFEKMVIRKVTWNPDTTDDALDVEIMRRLTWNDANSRSLLLHVLGRQLQCFGKRVHHITVFSFSNYICSNQLIPSCGIQGLSQNIDISDWIVQETQRLAQLITSDEWNQEGGILSPSKILAELQDAKSECFKRTFLEDEKQLQEQDAESMSKRWKKKILKK